MKAKLLCLLLVSFGCSGGVDNKMEEVQFLLDQGNYAAAMTKASEAVAEAPDNQQAKFLLASAMIGDSVITARSRCPNDTGYLGLLACLQDNQSANEATPMMTFYRIAPDEATKLGELESATDMLVTLTTTVQDPALLRDSYLQLWVARLFEISGVTTRLGVCTSNYHPDALTDAQFERFKTNLNEIPGDADKAGLPIDLGLNTRTIDILNSIGSSSSGDFFTEQFKDAQCS
jgi:hypothetical protein